MAATGGRRLLARFKGTAAADGRPRQGERTDFTSLLSWSPNSEKFRLLAGGLLALLAVVAVIYLTVYTAKRWPGAFGDSFALWSWGRFLAEHPAATIYDPAILRSTQLALGMAPGGAYPFAYPPSYLLVLWPLGQLPGPLSALAVLTAVSLPVYLWAMVGANWRSPALVAALVAPTTVIEIASGQSGFLAAALLAGGIRLAVNNPVTAGVLFGLLTYKPQLGLLVPVALVAARLWRTAAVAAASALLLVILTGLLFGAAVWPSWAAEMPAFWRQFGVESGGILHMMPTVLAALLRLGVAPAWAQLAQWAATAAAVAMVWALFRRGPGPLAQAGLLGAVFLATPYAFVYDMPILATAVIWLVTERQAAGDAFGLGEVLILIGALVSPVALTSEAARVPITLLALILLLGLIVRRHYRLSWSAALVRRPAAAARRAAGSL